MYTKFIKPTVDFIVALLLILVFLPLGILVGLGLFAYNKGTPFFIQKRPGKHERIFSIIKFKTMNDKRDASGELLSDQKRLTPIGKFVRATSLDEIPQLLNVVLGQMSIVGPRPLLPEYLPHYTDFQRGRHNVRPGITGWAQVNGRNTIQWEEKFKLDLWYVDNCSFLLDMKIIFLTIKKVLVKEGISASGHSTMPRFDEESTLKK